MEIDVCVSEEWKPHAKPASRLADQDAEVCPADGIKSWDPAVSRGCSYVGHEICRYALKFARVHKCVLIVVAPKVGVKTVGKFTYLDIDIQETNENLTGLNFCASF